jgi:hypothetical protein
MFHYRAMIDRVSSAWLTANSSARMRALSKRYFVSADGVEPSRVTSSHW